VAGNAAAEVIKDLAAFRQRWKFFIADGRPEMIREDYGREGLIRIVKHELAEAMQPKPTAQTRRQKWEAIAMEYGSLEDLPCLPDCPR
jgi:hypothetical protein